MLKKREIERLENEKVWECESGGEKYRERKTDWESVRDIEEEKLRY